MWTKAANCTQKNPDGRNAEVFTKNSEIFRICLGNIWEYIEEVIKDRIYKGMTRLDNKKLGFYKKIH